jgi:hypothetical protein
MTMALAPNPSSLWHVVKSAHKRNLLPRTKMSKSGHQPMSHLAIVAGHETEGLGTEGFECHFNRGAVSAFQL